MFLWKPCNPTSLHPSSHFHRWGTWTGLLARQWPSLLMSPGPCEFGCRNFPNKTSSDWQALGAMMGYCSTCWLVWRCSNSSTPLSMFNQATFMACHRFTGGAAKGLTNIFFVPQNWWSDSSIPGHDIPTFYTPIVVCQSISIIPTCDSS